METADFKNDVNNILFQKLLSKTIIRQPVKEISEKTNTDKGQVSKILNNKIPVSDKFIDKFAKAYNLIIPEVSNSEIDLANDPTGYYYPEVSASAGLEREMQNDELKKIPINIPGWGINISFINVYGDSMYPKYCSGEIIGIKEIESTMLHFGLAYVVIMQDGEVYLKYITGGKDDEHFVLSSENPKNPSREYHLSLIRKIYIVKGVITKTTM